MSDDLVVHLWTDGSGTSLGNPGGWAYVLTAVHPVTGVERTVEGFGGEVSTTNNRMEMTALMMGLRAITRPSKVVAHCDSQYIIKPFTDGYIEDWERRFFAKVKNMDLWLQLAPEVRRHDVTFEWVKGHSGVAYNERCDKLAGAERRRLLALAEQAHS